MDELNFVDGALLGVIHMMVFMLGVPDSQVVPSWVDEAVVIEKDQWVMHIEGVWGGETGSDSVQSLEFQSEWRLTEWH